MKKREWQFYCALFLIFEAVFVFFIIRGVADITSNGFGWMKIINLSGFAVLVFFQTKCVMLFYRRLQGMGLK